MTTLAVASSEADAKAMDAVEQHHAELAGELLALVAALVTAVDSREGEPAARGRLVDFCRTQLLPHAVAEEQTMYAAAHDDERSRLLVDAMLAEHRRLERLVEDLAGGGTLGGAAEAYALLVLFEEHVAKEIDLLLPALALDPRVSLAGALQEMRDLLDAAGRPRPEPADATSAEGGCGCGCSCGSETDAPELDVREVPHAIRHATVFGALNAVPPQGALVLVAPHDPVPLLNQIQTAYPGVFSVTYEQPGPVDWRLRITRTR